MDRNQIETWFDEQIENRKPLAQVNQTTAGELLINGYQYRIVSNVGNAFEIEQFKRVYNTFYSKYDYILGDLGYGQLRLTGFFYEENRNVSADVKIGAVNDFIIENCNFGAPYFILHNLEAKRVRNTNRRVNHGVGNRSRGRKNTKHQFITEKLTNRNRSVRNKKAVVVSESKEHGKRHFKIRQKQK